MNRACRFVFEDAVANVFMVVGAVLLASALHLGVNPADGSVVDATVRGTWIPVFLFLATLPAMAVMFVSGGGVVGLPLMYLAQLVVYWAIGKWFSWLVGLLRNTKQAD